MDFTQLTSNICCLLNENGYTPLLATSTQQFDLFIGKTFGKKLKEIKCGNYDELSKGKKLTYLLTSNDVDFDNKIELLLEIRKKIKKDIDSRYNDWYKDTQEEIVTMIENNMNLLEKDKGVVVGDEIKSLIENISNNDTEWSLKNIEEKLMDCCNAIENILKNENGKIQKIDNEIFLDIVTEENLKKLKNKLQCFRHANTNAIDERKKLLIEEKEFLLNLAITFISRLNQNKKENFDEEEDEFSF